MSALHNVEWEECVLEPTRDGDVERYVRRELGVVPPLVRYMAACPWVARSVVGLNQYHSLLARIDLHLADLVGIIVSQERSCRFCYATQRALLRIQGFSEARIRQLEGNLLDAALDPREQAALEFAKRLARASPLLRGTDLRSLHERGFAFEAARELAFVASTHVYFNLIATVPAIPPERIEKLPDRRLVRVLRPVFGTLLRSRMRAGGPGPPAAETRRGPYARLLVALDGLPAARALRQLLDEAFASPGLAVRAKALIFAVIARGLGCALSEAEARGIALEHGLSETDFDAVLTHLGSPVLEPVEAAIVREARHTIWYRPVDVQRRARHLLDQLTPRQFVEFVGTCALANAVCRLVAVLEPR